MTQDDAFKILTMGKPVFLTGAAGSGKTYLLNKYIEWLRMRGIETAVTASTGIAATSRITAHFLPGLTGIVSDGTFTPKIEVYSLSIPILS